MDCGLSEEEYDAILRGQKKKEKKRSWGRGAAASKLRHIVP